MEVFYAVMLRGSVTAAAKYLNRTQPAVTKVLRHTEDQLKFPLFHRIKGRLIPTDEAIALFPDVERVFDEVRAVEQSLDDVRSVRTGALRIASIPTFGQVALPQAVAAFTRDHPGVKITFDVRPKRAVVQSIATGRSEIGFAFLADEHANVATEPLCEGSMVCLLPPGHKLSGKEVITPLELHECDMVGYSHGQALRPIIDSVFTAARCRYNPVIDVAWISTAWSMVAGGVGVALVDDFSRMDRIFPDVEVRPFQPTIAIPAKTLMPRGQPLSRLAQEFLKVARGVLSAP
ncbi:LysR family transcriptional regulator [Psychromarinibacter halotolerans]|uniref:LysR family transcriptional regulator n=1 Tax=Psychromarinibacter halotolerans TaxID=1775175 RepID=A0ABV7GSB8_9RHOB|nr:LysR family transcriptional regulator [Psychromarinibacter halotolerans]MDF0597540.1 LysR family transcriptional regulator [Psychromarinibacter halotolerans]